MANTTWSTTDKSTNNVLSGTNNLTVTIGAGGGGGRTIDRQGSGKYYFEGTLTTILSIIAFGVANGNANVAGAVSTPLSAAVVQQTGNIWVNNVNSGSTLGTLSNGNVIGVALDQDNKLIWFRVAPSGNWNGSAAANPATPVGGISIASISPDSRLLPLYGFYGSNSSGSVATANFGDTAFSGAVPSGFTSGFPTNVPPLYAAESVLAREVLSADTNALLYQSTLAREVLLSQVTQLWQSTLAREVLLTGDPQRAGNYAVTVNVA